MKSNKILAAIAVSTALLVGGTTAYGQIANKQVPNNTVKTEAVTKIQKQDTKGKTTVINDGEVNLAITQHTKEEAAGNKVIKGAIDKINSYFPETKDFEIASVQTNKGSVTGQEMNCTMINLKEKGGNGKELNFTIDATTGDLMEIQQLNWKATDKTIESYNKEQIKERADELLTDTGLDLKKYTSEVGEIKQEVPKEKIEDMKKNEIKMKKTLAVLYKQAKNQNGKVVSVYLANNSVDISFIHEGNEPGFNLMK